MWDNDATKIFYDTFCNSIPKLEEYGIIPEYYNTINELENKLIDICIYYLPESYDHNDFVFNINTYFKKNINFKQIAEYLWKI